MNLVGPVSSRSTIRTIFLLCRNIVKIALFKGGKACLCLNIQVTTTVYKKNNTCILKYLLQISFFFSQTGQYFRAGYRWFVQMISYRIDPLKQLCLLIYKHKHSWIPWGYKYLWKNSKVKRQFRIFVKHLPLPNLLRKRRKKR